MTVRYVDADGGVTLITLVDGDESNITYDAARTPNSQQCPLCSGHGSVRWQRQGWPCPECTIVPPPNALRIVLDSLRPIGPETYHELVKYDDVVQAE